MNPSNQTYFRAMSHFGRFRILGSDAAQLLHHLTTNNIKQLNAGEGCDAILISNKARVLDWLSVWRDGDGYEVLTSPNRREMFVPHARKFVLFRQDVKFEDVSESGALFGLFGEDVKPLLADLKMEHILDAPLNARIESEFDDVKFKLSRTRRLPQNGVLIECDDGDALQKLVSESGILLCDDETYNIARIEAGIPAAGLELTEEINPWEANLDFAISLEKGCYNGQEVVARLHTYQKIKRNLMGLKLENPMAMSELTASRVLLKCDGRDAGFLTSSALSSRLGPIALGYVRAEFQDTGRTLQVLATSPQSAIVSTLPFV